MMNRIFVFVKNSYRKYVNEREYITTYDGLNCNTMGEPQVVHYKTVFFILILFTGLKK